MTEKFQTHKAKKYFGDDDDDGDNNNVVVVADGHGGEKGVKGEGKEGGIDNNNNNNKNLKKPSIPSELQQQLSNQFLVARKQAIERLTNPLQYDKTKLSEIQNYVNLLLLQDSWQSHQSAFILANYLIKYTDTKFHDEILKLSREFLEHPEHRVREALAECVGELAKADGLQVYLKLKPDIFRLIRDNFERADADASGPEALQSIQEDKKKVNEEKETHMDIDNNIHLHEKEKHKHDEHEHEHGHDHDHNPEHEHEHNHNHNHNQKTNESTPKQHSSTSPVQLTEMEQIKLKEREQQQIDLTDEEHNKTPYDTKSPNLRHDTEGWKCLWSAMKTLEQIIVGLEKRFQSEINDELLDLLERAIGHINRFVREVTFQLYAAICRAHSSEGLEKIGMRIAKIIRLGLGDNWSQVRYASSLAAREFFDTIAKENHRKYFSILLPPMCLNRYYMAAGVRTYALESWKKLVNNLGLESGVGLVAEFIDDIVVYFAQQAMADNHAVREAACHCIAELGTKVDHQAVGKHVPTLLDVLIACFKDMSWPVRDAACTALGDFVSSFPEQSKKDLDELYHLWYEHLSDNIPSVREDSAAALGKVIKAFGDPAIKIAIAHLHENLPKVKNQPSDSKRYGELEKSTTFGVAAKRIRDNDPAVHTGQQHYSCGSLAPKLQKATRSGCMDHGFSRNREPWEYTDGAVHLLKELVIVHPPAYDTFIPILADIANIRSFAHYPQLQLSIWNNVPAMAKAIGVRKYKMYLELLLPPMIETLTCGNHLAMNAAGSCIQFTNDFMGSRFFLARLKPDQEQAIRKSPFVKL